MNIIKKILLVLLLAFVVIQFIRPAKNNGEPEGANHISKSYNVPNGVKAILEKACNDCHSNNTTYPWYANIQPVTWWLNSHIVDGKKHLNFSEFTTYNLRRQYHKMEEVISEVDEKHMPISSYTITHGDAKLSDAEKTILTNWAQTVMDTMKARYPIDSLIKKKS